MDVLVNVRTCDDLPCCAVTVCVFRFNCIHLATFFAFGHQPTSWGASFHSILLGFALHEQWCLLPGGHNGLLPSSVCSNLDRAAAGAPTSSNPSQATAVQIRQSLLANGGFLADSPAAAAAALGLPPQPISGAPAPPHPLLRPAAMLSFFAPLAQWLRTQNTRAQLEPGWPAGVVPPPHHGPWPIPGTPSPTHPPASSPTPTASDMANVNPESTAAPADISATTIAWWLAAAGVLTGLVRYLTADRERDPERDAGSHPDATSDGVRNRDSDGGCLCQCLRRVRGVCCGRCCGNQDTTLYQPATAEEDPGEVALAMPAGLFSIPDDPDE